MARGDVRPTRSNYSRGSYGGGSSSFYDDEGRGQSKDLWEWFEENFNAASDKLAWLMGMSDSDCYRCIKYTVSRFNVYDVAIYSRAEFDTRARRLVVGFFKRDGETVWTNFHTHLKEGYDRYKEHLQMEEHQRAEESRGRWAAYEAEREAMRVKVLREEAETLMPPVEITVGMLQSDLNQVFVQADKIGDSGDWIDDPVAAFDGHDGWGYEDNKAVGTKIQFTISLDLSNSMIYNGVALAAANAFRDIGLAAIALKSENPNDLFVGMFTFSEDEYGDSGYGKRTRTVNVDNHMAKVAQGNPFGALDEYRPSRLQNELYSRFDGTDTWVSPLFAAIERWERDNSDPGAVRLDLVITDAVLEHAKDIRDADTIQERRNGTLTTVFLNFMPESEWLNSTLPKRCYQMHVDTDNIQGILRNMITEFVTAHV